jgi:hypothetical protein
MTEWITRTEQLKTQLDEARKAFYEHMRQQYPLGAKVFVKLSHKQVNLSEGVVVYHGCNDPEVINVRLINSPAEAVKRVYYTKISLRK